MSSVILSNPDFNLQSQLRQGDDHLIFKQAIQENDLEETYDAKFNNITQQEHLDLKPEDLSVIIENNFGNQNYSSSKVQQQDEIFNTFKQLMKNARSQPKIEEIQQFDKNQSSHQNSIQMPNQIQNRIGYSQLSGNNYERQKSFKGQSGKYSKDMLYNLYLNFKPFQLNMNANLDQRSDFTFVLTNQTDFHCECAQQDNNQNNSSFVTNKFRKPSTVNNSDLKSQNQNLSSYRKGPFQTITQPPRLQDFGASPIYSENGGLPGTQFYINPPVGVCNNCGGCRNQSNQHKKQQHTNIQHRLSYNQVNYQSIKEESQDGDEEYRQNENFINSQIDDSGVSGNSHNVDQQIELAEATNQQQLFSTNQKCERNGDYKWRDITLIRCHEIIFFSRRSNKQSSRLNIFPIRIILLKKQNSFIYSQRQSNFINQLNTSTSYLGANQEQSSKQLLEINDRLTKQIEDNLALFEDLNQELTLKDRLIADNHQRLQEKQKEVELLSKRLNDMSDSQNPRTSSQFYYFLKNKNFHTQNEGLGRGSCLIRNFPPSNQYIRCTLLQFNYFTIYLYNFFE